MPPPVHHVQMLPLVRHLWMPPRARYPQTPIILTAIVGAMEQPQWLLTNSRQEQVEIYTAMDKTSCTQI